MEALAPDGNRLEGAHTELSRLDGATDLHNVSLVTSLPEERLNSVLRELVQLGAVTADASAATPPETPSAEAAEAPDAAMPELEDEPAQPGDAETEASSKTHRALYAAELRDLPIGDRITHASVASDPTLSALCFDPLPQVIAALLENEHTGLTQARLIAADHPNSAGVKAMTAKASFAADAGVRRALLKNMHLPVGLYRRLWSGKRLLEQFKVAVSREVAEVARRASRETLRARFTSAAPDERVELIMKTEGRCLTMLAGLPIDSKTTAQLCGRTYGSNLLVERRPRKAHRDGMRRLI